MTPKKEENDAKEKINMGGGSKTLVINSKTFSWTNGKKNSRSIKHYVAKLPS